MSTPVSKALISRPSGKAACAPSRLFRPPTRPPPPPSSTCPLPLLVLLSPLFPFSPPCSPPDCVRLPPTRTHSCSPPSARPFAFRLPTGYPPCRLTAPSPQSFRQSYTFLLRRRRRRTQFVRRYIRLHYSTPPPPELGDKEKEERHAMMQRIVQKSWAVSPASTRRCVFPPFSTS